MGVAPIHEPDVHRLTVEEFLRIVDDLHLERVELIDGVIYDVNAQYDLHADAVHAIQQLLTERYPDRKVRAGGSIKLGGDSIWEPDVVVKNYPPPSDGLRYSEADEVVLVVEVAVTSWSKDSGSKLAGYAKAGVPECWIVDPKVGGRAVRCRSPRVDDDGAFSYSDVTSVALPDGLDDLPRLGELFDL
jgi:Uma2 family endonuclease